MKRALYEIGTWVRFTPRFPTSYRPAGQVGQVVGATYRRPGYTEWTGEGFEYITTGPPVYVLQVRTSYMGKPVDVLPEHCEACDAPEGGLPYHPNAMLSDADRKWCREYATEDMIRDERGRFVRAKTYEDVQREKAEVSS